MKIYCAGIGGMGLSAYAGLQRSAGHDVLGSDRVTDSPLLADLRAQGVTIVDRQDGSCLPADVDLFVYSEALAPEHPERAAAQRLGLRSLSYFAALGALTQNMRVIAVCGTHGKSSTTAMLAQVLIDAGQDPTVVLGATFPLLDGRNWRRGAGDLAVIEACEYRRSFHFLRPTFAVLTTIDGDHFDAYGSLDAYRTAFREFFQMLPADGSVIAHGGDTDGVAVVRAAGRRLVDADLLPAVQVGIAGEHMRSNGRLALAAALELDVDDAGARASLAAFAGIGRRMERMEERQDGVTVIDDYAHHPAEIRATLAAVREAYPGRRLLAVFQPHTHDRTLALWDAFTQAFSDADAVVVTDIYDARAYADRATADPAALAAAITARSGVAARQGGTLDATQTALEEMLQPGDVVVCMGAGTITGLAARLSQRR